LRVSTICSGSSGSVVVGRRSRRGRGAAGASVSDAVVAVNRVSTMTRSDVGGSATGVGAARSTCRGTGAGTGPRGVSARATSIAGGGVGSATNGDVTCVDSATGARGASTATGSKCDAVGATGAGSDGQCCGDGDEAPKSFAACNSSAADASADTLVLPSITVAWRSDVADSTGALSCVPSSRPTLP
jgi:hypothetical protein